MLTTIQLRNELNMLQGNINRMCITKDEKELAEQRDWAKHRIDTLFNNRQEQLQLTSPEST